MVYKQFGFRMVYNSSIQIYPEIHFVKNDEINPKKSKIAEHPNKIVALRTLIEAHSQK